MMETRCDSAMRKRARSLDIDENNNGLFEQFVSTVRDRIRERFATLGEQIASGDKTDVVVLPSVELPEEVIRLFEALIISLCGRGRAYRNGRNEFTSHPNTACVCALLLLLRQNIQGIKLHFRYMQRYECFVDIRTDELVDGRFVCLQSTFASDAREFDYMVAGLDHVFRMMPAIRSLQILTDATGNDIVSSHSSLTNIIRRCKTLQKFRFLCHTDEDRSASNIFRGLRSCSHLRCLTVLIPELHEDWQLLCSCISSNSCGLLDLCIYDANDDMYPNYGFGCMLSEYLPENKTLQAFTYFNICTEETADWEFLLDALSRMSTLKRIRVGLRGSDKYPTQVYDMRNLLGSALALSSLELRNVHMTSSEWTAFNNKLIKNTTLVYLTVTNLYIERDGPRGINDSHAVPIDAKQVRKNTSLLGVSITFHRETAFCEKMLENLEFCAQQIRLVQSMVVPRNRRVYNYYISLGPVFAALKAVKKDVIRYSIFALLHVIVDYVGTWEIGGDSSPICALRSDVLSRLCETSWAKSVINSIKT
jgi:hypothetical protein